MNRLVPSIDRDLLLSQSLMIRFCAVLTYAPLVFYCDLATRGSDLCVPPASQNSWNCRLWIGFSEVSTNPDARIRHPRQSFSPHCCAGAEGASGFLTISCGATNLTFMRFSNCKPGRVRVGYYFYYYYYYYYCTKHETDNVRHTRSVPGCRDGRRANTTHQPRNSERTSCTCTCKACGTIHGVSCVSD